MMHILQEHGKEVVEGAAGHTQHVAEAAGQAAHAAGHGEHIPFIVEKVNELVGPAIFELQAKIMPQIYHAVKIFGPQWPGEGKSYAQYVAEGMLPIPTQVVMFGIVILVAVIGLLLLRGKLSAEAPNNRQQTLEVGVEAIRELLSDLVGPTGMKHFPVVATFGTLILVSNLLGMMPDMVAPTASFNVTLALALSSFLYYNYVGIRENGIVAYFKHFAGPIPNIFIMLLMFPIEIVSNLARIMSLSMRLFGNIYGEEQVSGAIAAMMQWGVPLLLMPLALMTSVLQTFIFIVLSMVYLGEVSHHSEEHHGEHGHATAAAH
ncbi:MAG TPA: F0F1 ATP synthase subunit A [Blastocatellia bacterium]|nr:F0F1 ATP synthase subunit A [Blastocatellia bacterium]